MCLFLVLCLCLGCVRVHACEYIQEHESFWGRYFKTSACKFNFCVYTAFLLFLYSSNSFNLFLATLFRSCSLALFLLQPYIYALTRSFRRIHSDALAVWFLVQLHWSHMLENVKFSCLCMHSFFALLLLFKFFGHILLRTCRFECINFI